MKKTVVYVVLFLACFSLYAQKNKNTSFPLVAEKWSFEPGKVEFTKEEGKATMKILPGAGKVIAKDVDFTNGTIEFDVKPNTLTFHFRYKDAKESESFYFRMGRAGNAMAMDALQYAPYLDGVLMWDMLGHYQANASITKEAWNHVKLVISGAQMRMYVNSPNKPTLEIDKLEGNTTHGGLAFEGDMLVCNLQIKPNEVEGLSPLPGIDPAHSDPRYIRTWGVSEAITCPKNVDFSYDFLPTPETKWEVLEAERRGVVNLTRKFGKSTTRRIVWLKAKITSATVQKKKVDFGFGDDVWVFLNGKIVYVDKNLQGRPIAKEPDGRCSIENTSFVLPLIKGSNELLIGVANDFFGWGLIARLEDMDGIEIMPDPTFDSRYVKISEHLLENYLGKYVMPNGKPVMVTKEKNILRLSGEDFITASLYPEGENKFFMREYDLQIEFVKDGESKVSHIIVSNNGKPIMEVKRANGNL